MTAANKKDFRFATLLIPLRRNEKLPEIRKTGENEFQLTLHGMDYTIDLKRLAESKSATRR